MKLGRGAPRLRKALALALLCLSIPTLSQTAATAAGTLQTISVYGGNGTVGTVDSATEVSTDGGSTWGQAYFAGTHPWGLVAGTTTWINCGPTLNDCLNRVSWYRYRFYLSSDFETTTLTAAIKVDNLASMYINGSHLIVGGVNLNVSGGSGGTWSGSPPDWSTTDLPIQSYLHAGWNDISVELTDLGGLAGINYAFTIKTYSSSPIQLSTPGQVFTVTYDVQGGSISRSSDTATAGNAIASFPTPTKANATFDGWFTAASGGTQVSAPLTPSSDRTLYAHWTNTYVPPPVVYSTLFLQPQGGISSSTAITVIQGNTVTTLPLPTKSGYRFQGWFDDPSQGSEKSAPFALNANQTLYAHWQRIVHPVHYEGADTATVLDDLVAEGETLTALPSPTRSGYTFLGWFDSSTNSVEVRAPLLIAQPTTLFAHWSANTYSVSVNTPQGVITMPATQGSQFIAPAAVTPPQGFTFNGWSRDSATANVDFKAGEVITKIDLSKDFALFPVFVVKDQFKPGNVSSQIYFGLDEYFLDSADRKELARLVKLVRNHTLSNSSISVNIVGWVQPTSINPQIAWLSRQRALAVKRALIKLGLKAQYQVAAPGLAESADPESRKATIEISWKISS